MIIRMKAKKNKISNFNFIIYVIYINYISIKSINLNNALFVKLL